MSRPPTRHAGGRARRIAMALLALLTASCGTGSVSEPVPPLPSDPDTLVLRIREVRSLIPRSEIAGVPEFSLYADGRVIVPDGYAGAVPRARQCRVSRAKLSSIYRAAYDLDLQQGRRIAHSRVTDGSALEITLYVNGRRKITIVEQPGDRDGGPRARIGGFRDNLNPARWKSPDIVEGPTPLAASKLAVFSLGTGGVAGPDDRPWTVHPVTEGTSTVAGLCTVLDGAARDEAEELARSAARDARWSTGGQPVTLAFRPMLPDEADCTALGLNPR